MAKTGSISVHTENIFPIIKKFLYSDHDIFIRELVSNATDACKKLSALSRVGEFKGETGDLRIVIRLDEEKKTLTISDNGVGMTEDEIERYINQLAFSGAEEFVSKYKDKTDAQVIGHFGLGFYSSFMVASKVEIQTKSWREEAAPAKWECDGSTSFNITKGKRKERGTDIILHFAEDSLEFNNKFRISSLLEKYCRFLPVPIEFDGKVINEEKPLWLSKPSELSSDDYIKFYKVLYPMAAEPLFWIHLNVDYPFNLTGILYFPKVDSAIEAEKHKVQLYSNQVYVTDNVRDILPEFLMLLHGVIDSPDIPLNVSRSSLQSDANVKKITTHISKKVADKLSELFKNDRTDFETKWEAIDLFVKYGLLSDEKFAERASEFCLLKNTEGKYFTIQEYREKIAPLQTDKDEKIVWLYTGNADEQHAYVSAVQEKGYDVLVLEGPLDGHFTGYLERQQEKIQCKRVDSDAPERLIKKEDAVTALLSEEQSQKLKAYFEKINKMPEIVFAAEALSTGDPLVTLTESEFDRRMRDMSKTGGFNMFGQMPVQYQAVLNTNSRTAMKLVEADEKQAEEMADKALRLAMLSKGLLKGEALTTFIKSEFGKL